MPTDKQFTGQRLDATGLYYYGARYYDAGVGRFISPDNVMPDLMNPQSLVKYAYCFNNPLKYIDPLGHWPNWSKIGSTISNGFKAVVNAVKSDPIGAIQTALDVAGMIPVVGEAFDVVSGVVSLARGDLVGAGLSLASAIPVIGNIAGGAKIAKGAVKLVEKTANEIGYLTKKVHGNTANDAKATLYVKVDKDGNLLKWGVTKDSKTRYTKAEIGEGRLIEIETGSRSEMLDKERELVETFPGPDNHEPWAGTYWLK